MDLYRADESSELVFHFWTMVFNKYCLNQPLSYYCRKRPVEII